MKKTLLFTLLAILLGNSHSICAQEDKFCVIGIKAGINLSYMSGFKHNDYAQKIKSEVGFTGGITIDLSVAPHWAILSAIEYVPKNVNFEMNTTEISTIIPSYKSKYLQVPIHAGYKLKTAEDSKIIFHLGPYFAYGLNGDIEWQDRNTQLSKIVDFFHKDLFHRFDYGLGLGINVDTKNFALNVGYDHGLRSINKSTFYFPDKDYIDTDDLSIQTRNFYITLGYKFRWD